MTIRGISRQSGCMHLKVGPPLLRHRLLAWTYLVQQTHLPSTIFAWLPNSATGSAISRSIVAFPSAVCGFARFLTVFQCVL